MELDFAGWLIFAAVATAAWFGGFGWVVWRTRPSVPTAAPASAALLDEPPAVAQLLANRWHLEPSAAAATLLDLAARGVLAIERLGDQPGQALCRVRQETDDGLTEFEQQVMFRVRQVAVTNAVPLPGLAHGTVAESRHWLAEFARGVVAHARARGLSQPRLRMWARMAMIAAAVVPGVLLGAATAALVDHPAGMLVGVVVPLFCARLVWRLRGERDTARGREVAARWLGVRDYLAAHPGLAEAPPAAVNLWQRYLSYAAALGVAPTALQGVQLGPGDDRVAWSAYGGTWRRVGLRYPRWPQWGFPLDAVFGVAVAWLAWGAGISWLLGIRLWSDNSGLAMAGWAVGGAGFGWGVFTIYKVVVDFVAPVKLVGQVLHFREQHEVRRAGSGWFYRHRTFVTVDDGHADSATGYAIPANLRDDIAEDDIVELRVGRYFGRVRSARRLREGWRWRMEPTAVSAEG